MAIEKFADQASESFTMPEVCVKLRAMLDDGKHDLDDIAQLIVVDPNLSAKVLRLANSALFRFPSQISSVTKAISVIGGEALYNIVMAETASLAFKHFDSQLVDIERHWHNSVYCGMAAKHTALILKKRASDRFFAMGILQGLADLVIAKNAADTFRKINHPDAKGLPWQRQQHELGFAFAQCSGAILERWKLPLPLYYPIAQMHNTARVKQDADVAIMTFAAQLTEYQANAERYRALKLWEDDTQPALALTDEQIESIIDSTEKDTARVASMILQ
ncbi:HDOD domain-containing protein [Alteromonas sp. ASW11-36]|uniref:HDOD domain-containing protein n=1 Tax=Alteromonas arenosi TaxID=3055817 RepID=A0ABT7STM7_9ALTE|nr:HDOD domain-containing protein [Alteromonas sp. ASW11-36]MDM7859558.1 HDOD domain-containing protein [Alteromonas sp. ASW11-36]